MFGNCEKLVNVPITTFKGCSSVTSMSYAFYMCRDLILLEGIFDDLISVTSFTYAFMYATRLKLCNNLF